MRIIICVTLMLVFRIALANSKICEADLRNLVIPVLSDVKVNKKDIRIEIEDYSKGVYSAELYVLADGRDNLDGRVSIGWVNLDINSMKVYDVTRDPDHPKQLILDDKKYNRFVARCLRGSDRLKSN